MLGPLALLGSGEFLPAMDPLDRRLLASSARQRGHVLIVPTAAALEPGMPEVWAARGVAHFARFAVPATPAMIRDRGDADDPDWTALVADARLVYFSGGNPQFLADTLAGTRFLAAVRDTWWQGMALAGCSAGAMFLGDLLPGIPGDGRLFTPGTGMLPALAVVPHYNQAECWWPGAMANVRASRPTGVTVLCLDDLTAVCLDTAGATVLGAGDAHLLSDTGEQTVSAGTRWCLPAWEALHVATARPHQLALAE